MYTPNAMRGANVGKGGDEDRSGEAGGDEDAGNDGGKAGSTTSMRARATQVVCDERRKSAVVRFFCVNLGKVQEV